jgi:large subunit ribosomal protein L37e
LTKGTTHFGKRGRGRTHIRCRRCGKHAYHIRHSECASCGFGNTAKIRKYAWLKPKIGISKARQMMKK